MPALRLYSLARLAIPMPASRCFRTILILNSEECLDIKRPQKVSNFLGSVQSNHWLEPFLQHCRLNVPFYQDYPWHLDFDDLPSIQRADLSHAYSQFVPNDIEPGQL